ncbi:MAG: DAK2 domain-containing protein [Oscillospiraceae bacterium]|jgi:DAK2 domain fusion protein YloV|nr:DAK2 domain-containing protein [Oscillospiraceae bacterium]
MNSAKQIDGELLHQLLSSGFENLGGNVRYLNDINVFPVSDGDTGTNMKRTFEAGMSELITSSSFSDVLSSFIQGMLLGSRGNSGSILSQYFLGMYEYAKGKDAVSVADFCQALKNASQFAYEAVLQPVEGTILTVMRESIGNAAAQVNENTSLVQFFDIFTVELLLCVQNTTNRLDILRSNNVVDSGAAGFYLIFDGMKNGLHNTGVSNDSKALFAAKNAQNALSPPAYRYCTEFLLKMREYHAKEFFVDLLSNKGDSLIVSASENVLKVHIHTNEPQSILDEFSRIGDLAETKIEDMLIQQEINQFSPLNRKHGGYVIITFVHGDGIMQLFDELGCDIVFNATQNYRVSEESFHFFINKFANEEIVLLPNNEEIYDTAVSLYPPSLYPNVHIIDSRNVIKSYYLLSMMIGTDSIDKVLETFSVSGQSKIFIAKILSITIQRVKYFVGFTDSETVMNKNLDDLLRIIASLESISSYSSVIVFFGQTAKDEDAAKVSRYFEDCGDMDFAMLDGKQDDFDYIIGAM